MNGLIGAIVQVTTGFLAVCISDFTHCGPIRAKSVSHHDLRIAISPHRFSHKFQCRGPIPALRDEGLQDFAFMVDGPPQIMGLPTDLYEHFAEMPPPLWRLPHSFSSTFADLVREVSAETVHPMTNRFMADIDSALMKQVLDIA